jgi:hypothetical protein
MDHVPERPIPNWCEAIQSDAFPVDVAGEHFTLLEKMLREAIAQRDEARTSLGAVALSLGIHEESVASTAPLMMADAMESWAKDVERAEKAEAALATARAQYREEGLREAAGKCAVNAERSDGLLRDLKTIQGYFGLQAESQTWRIAEKDILALIPKK